MRSSGPALVACALLQAACDDVECDESADCDLNFDCNVDGVCIASPQGSIRWISPEPGSVVGERFDAVVEVSFRALSAVVVVNRDEAAPGDACAPFIPARVEIPGDVGEALVQQVTLPNLLATGETFGVRATLQAAGGTRVASATLHGVATGYEGATFTAPVLAAQNADGAQALTVSAVLDQVAENAALSVEPLDGLPSPRVSVGSGITSIDDARVPLARGPQIVWLDAVHGGASHRCGLGVEGVGETRAGLELGLWFEGAEPGQLDLRLLVERASGDDTCSFQAPVAGCKPVYETRAPTRDGEEMLLLAPGDAAVTVAVVPGAASEPMRARVRVTNNGVHVGWLGPVGVQPAAGETWVAGRVVVTGGLTTLQPLDDFAATPPF